MAGLNPNMQKLLEEYDALDESKTDSASPVCTLGMAFNGYNICFAELEKIDDGITVNKYGTVPTNMKFGSGIEGVEKNIRDVANFLNGYIDIHNIKARHLNLSLNTHLTTMHKLTIPHSFSSSESEEFIRWEFGQQVIDDILLFTVNTHMIGESESSRTILAVGVKKKIVDTFVTVLEKAKIQLVNIDVDILCSQATYELNYGKASRGLTVLADLKTGVVTFLLCNGPHVLDLYQFIAPQKATPEILGDLLNHHLGNALELYNSAAKPPAVIHQVILCQSFSPSILPHINAPYHAEMINPFYTLNMPKPYEMSSDDSEGSTEESEKKETQSAEDTSLYAEAIGAAAKLLVNERS